MSPHLQILVCIRQSKRGGDTGFIDQIAAYVQSMGGGLENLSRTGVQPGHPREHGVAGGRRQRRALRLHHLGQVERVAAGELEECFGVR